MVIFVANPQPDYWQFQLGSIFFNTRLEPDADGCLWTMPEPDGWESPAVRVNPQDIPYGDGQDVGDVFWQARTIHATGQVQCVTATGDEGAAAIDRAKSRLLRETRLLRHDGQFVGRDSLGTWYANCRRADRTVFPERPGPEASTFDFALIAGDPLKYSIKSKSVRIDNRNPSEGGLVSPWIAPLISTTLDQSAEETVTSVNDGDLDAPMIVNFVGPLTNPKLFDRANGYQLRLNTYIPEGRTVQVDPANRTVTADSTLRYDFYDTAWSTPLDQLVVPAESSCAWVLIAQGAGHVLVTHRDCKE